MSEVDGEGDDASESDLAREEDATTRVEARSLLISIKVQDIDEQWPVDFCHRSIREYFVAKRVCRFIDEEPGTAKSVLTNNLLGHEILDFAAGLMRQDGSERWSNRLTEFARATESAKHPGYLGANAITLLFRVNGELPGADWSSLVLDQADLSGADLSGKNFSHSSLRDANLDNVNFEEADFCYCGMCQ